jgi:molybdate transport system ATP-binding protein
MSLNVSIRKKLSRTFSLEVEFESSPSGERGKDNCLGILGPSGCGKSMTLKCIAGIETPDEGHISVNGRVLFDSGKKINLRPQMRRVGCLFQNYALFPRMTVLENISAALSGKERTKQAMEWIARFGLLGLERSRPAQLSGGQQQRTALARMLIREPDVILLDEPFSALDSGLREQMQLQLLELLDSRGDVIMVTHSRDEAYKLCGEILVMKGGRVLAKGETRDLFANPVSVAAARITGCKNISPVKRTGEHEIFALDWGLSLRTARPVGPDITHAGIRAHDLRLAASEDHNLVRPRVSLESEEPFEKVVLFTNAEAKEAREHGEIWWKYSKYLSGAEQSPECLFIPPEAILLLKEESRAE